MKKYIQPNTQFIALGAEKLCQELGTSLGSGDPWSSDSPLRKFEGMIQSLKYLI